MGVLKRQKTSQAAVESRIRSAIEALKPLLPIEDCGIHLAQYEVTTGIAWLHVSGGCPDCDMSVTMLMEGISAHLRQRITEIREVRATEINAEDGNA